MAHGPKKYSSFEIVKIVGEADRKFFYKKERKKRTAAF
jgi:hypothetical protein